MWAVLFCGALVLLRWRPGAPGAEPPEEGLPVLAFSASLSIMASAASS
jgi:hypothetical protein